MPDIDGRPVPSVSVQVNGLRSSHLSSGLFFLTPCSPSTGEIEGQFCSPELQVDCQYPATIGRHPGPVCAGAHGSVSFISLYTSIIKKTIVELWFMTEEVLTPSESDSQNTLVQQGAYSSCEEEKARYGCDPLRAGEASLGSAAPPTTWGGNCPALLVLLTQSASVVCTQSGKV